MSSAGFGTQSSANRGLTDDSRMSALLQFAAFTAMAADHFTDNAANMAFIGKRLP